MRILVVNVNTNESVTEDIARAARQAASAGTEIVALTPRFGSESVEGNFESYLAAVGVMDIVMAYNETFDAVVQAGFGEHGREGLQELVNVPVIDITEAAAHLAMMLGYRFSIVTTLQRTVPQILDRLRVAGVLEHCASVRATGLSVLELAEDPARTCRVVVNEAMKAIRNDQAEVICLGCGGLAGLDQMVADEAGVPVVDGVGAAVGLAETLVRLGLSTSKIGAYASPLPKARTGWPIPRGDVAP